MCTVAVGGVQVFVALTIPLRLPVCVWSLQADAEGWGGSVADMKVKGESCLPTLPWGEPSES